MFIEGVAHGIGPLGGAQRVGRRRSGGYAPGPIETLDEPVEVAAAREPQALEGLLALQECQAGFASRGEARRFGQAVLGELGKLQLGMLRPEGPSRGDLRRLADLCDSVPYTDDATLRGLLQSVVLRARIELARG